MSQFVSGCCDCLDLEIALKYVIGSGWWSADEPLAVGREKLGDDIIRTAKFHELDVFEQCFVGFHT